MLLTIDLFTALQLLKSDHTRGSRDNKPTIDAMFSGSLTQMDLAAVLRLLSASSQTGSLAIVHEEFHAEIGLYAGQLVHAETSAFSGLDALYEICQHTGGSFRFNASVPPDKTSLTDYAPDELLQNIEATLQAARELAASRPEAADVPLLLSTTANGSVSATADDLQLLLLADGTRTVEALAAQSGRDVDQARDIFARFILAGLVTLKASDTPPADPEPSVGEQTPFRSANPRPTRFWRGKRIE